MLGVVFWTLAAHRYPASTVGVFSSLTAGAGLLAAIAALGLENTMTRHVASAENPRELVVVTVTVIATIGTILCLLTVLALGPHLPPTLDLQQRGRMVVLITVLVAFTAISGIIDAGLVAIRASRAVFTTNLVGSIVKVTALLLLTGFHSYGLLISYGLALVVSTVLAAVALIRQISGKRVGLRSVLILRRYLSFTSGNYLASIMGILPATVVPIEVLLVRGATETARFGIAGMIAGFLSVIPSTVAQVLFAEASRQGVPLGQQLRKALRGVYGLLLPAVVVTVAAAPLLLSIFGAAYATAATGCLRIFALSTLLTGGTYLVDSLLIARDRITAYVFINGANAALVLGCVGILLPRGITAGAGGWALAQGLSLLLGLVLLAMGRAGRHHSRIQSASTGKTPQFLRRYPEPRSVNAFEPQIRELLATWPLMPTTLIAETIGWDQSIQVLLDRVTELRSAYSRQSQHASRTRSLPGEIAQCGFWFPPAEIPVGFGQIRSARHLPVLTMITGYSRWLSAILIHSTQSQDVLEGWWQLLATLGAVPRTLIWDSSGSAGRLPTESARDAAGREDFCRALGASIVIGRPADSGATGLIERAHIYLERSFLPNRQFTSPMDFNGQLRDWVWTANIRPREPPRRSPAELISVDRKRMLPLPAAPPSADWHQSLSVGSRPFIRFDSNDYSLSPAAIGRRVELVASSSQINVFCDGRLVAAHERAWAHNQVITDRAHGAAS